MAAAILEMSIVFGLSEKVYDQVQGYNIRDALKWSLAGGLSGLGVAIPNHVLDSFKIRAQLGKPCLSTFANLYWYKGLDGRPWPAKGLDGRPWPAKGLDGRPWPAKGLDGRPWPAKGLHWTFLREVPAFSVYFGTYHWLRDGHQVHSFASGAVAGWASWLFTYPIDVVKTRVQAGLTYDKAWLVDPKIWRGFGIVSARALLVNGVGFWTYDLLRQV